MSEKITTIEEIRRPIRHAFFDLGGVVFSFSNGLKSIAQIVDKPLEDITVYWRSKDDKICLGELAPQQFWDDLVSHFGSGNKDMDFLEFWTNHFQPIQQTHDAMKALHSNGVQIGIITNIYPGVFNIAKEKEVIPTLDYHTVVQSCDLGVIKPNTQIFNHALTQTGLRPNEVILVDDLAENIQAVEGLGWKSLLFTNN